MSGQSLIEENCHNSRASDDIDMKLEPVSKLDKKNKTTQKKIDNDVMSKIVTSSPFFAFLSNLEQSGGRILDTEGAKVLFSVIVTISLTKTQNRTEKSPTQVSHYCFE